MKVTFTIFNNPSKLGISKKRKSIKENYSFMVHNGVPRHTKVFFTSWAKDTKGQRKAYQNDTPYGRVLSPFEVKEREPIQYFIRAIEMYQERITNAIKKYVDIGFNGTKFVVDQKGLIQEYKDIANLIMTEAQSIIRAEAFDTGDLMDSVTVTDVIITGV